MKEMENPVASGLPEAPKLDLSKVKNLEAVSKRDDAGFVNKLEEKAKLDSKKRAKAKFNFTEEYDIQLPSGGKFYQNESDENIKKGIVTIKPMSIAEEEMLSNKAYIKQGSMFRRVFNSVISNSFDAGHLISYDSLYLMYALRKVSYGDDYTVEFQCPDCEKAFKHTFNISDVSFDEIEDDIETLRTLEFPVSKFKAVMEISRLKDDEELERLKKANPDVPEIILTYVIRTRELYDHDGDPINPSDWIDFFTALPVRDRALITKSFARDGKSPTIDVICPKCGTETETEIPFQSDFFRSTF